MARRMLALGAVIALAATACSSDDNGKGKASPARTTSSAAPAKRAPAVVFNGEGNNLNAISTVAPFEKQNVIRNHDDDPNGLDINAQICFFPDKPRRFIAGEDTNQPNPPQGWGIFDLTGDKVGAFKATEVGKLTPTYQPSASNAENYGCGFLRDGRVLTSDVGNQAAGNGDGQLIVWFPPFDSRQVRYCKLDVNIATAGQIYVDDQDRIYVASARPGNPSTGVLRYTGPFPTSDDAAGGCGKKDATGAPVADAVSREQFVTAVSPILTPNAMAPTGHGGFYVSSVFNGVIAEVDGDGKFVRTVLSPPAGETLGTQTYSTGTPLGLGVDADGTLYYADIGIVISPEVGPGPKGSVRRIRFVDGKPQPPEVLADGLAFPDGIGIYQPTTGG
jgi:sugar lactone lactonase YvrE